VKYAAFFRNLNLGRANSPTRAQLEQAFIEAGAESASSFLSNGTLVFSPARGQRPHKVLAAACESLRGVCGLKEPAFLRRVDRLAELVASEPFAAVDPKRVYECCVTFLSADVDALPALPLLSPRGDVEVLRFTGSEALSTCQKRGNTAGSPNLLLEKLLGSPATTRNWSTVVRLVDRHG
jgi:uncharacterized protein (DUF1697 family)